MTIVNRACAIRRASWRPESFSELVQRPCLINIYAVKTGSEFVTTSNYLKISGFDRPHDSKFFAYSKLSALESGFKKNKEHQSYRPSIVIPTVSLNREPYT